MNDCPVRVGEHDGVSLSELRGPDRLSARYRIDYQARTFRSIRANIQLNLILGCVAVAIALALNAPVPVVGVWALALLLLSVAILAQVPVSVSHTSTAWIAHAMPPGLNGLIWGGFAYCVPTHHLSVGVGVCLAIGFVAVARLAVYQRVAMAHLVGSAVALLGPTSSNPDAPLWVITGVAIAGAAYGVLRLQDASRQQFRDHVEQAELSGVIEVLHNQLAPPAVSHEAFANAIAESLTDALITVDSDRTIVSANHNAGRLASQARQRLNGQTLNDVFELRAHGRATTLEWQDILDCGVPQQALLGAPSSGTRYPTIIRGVAHPGGHTLIIQDLTETLSAQRLAAHNLSRDPVSSGFNRTAFQSELSDVLARVSDQTPAALVFVELEQYDQVLEACGYPAADELIRQLSDTLRQRLRHSDTFARLEPRQFAVLLPECSFTQAQTVATELRESVNQSRFRWHDEAFELTMALGVIALAPGSTPPDAMRHALSALRVASGQGANRLHASPPQDAQHERRLSLQTWRSAVQEAIDGDQFQLFYQPIALCASLKAGAVPQPTHVEILLRMQHAEGGPIAAKDFITAAEQFSMMPTVDKWVVSRVFQLLDSPAFVDRTRDIDRFGINLSGQSISDPSFLDYVLGLTNAAGFDTRRIYFEITETAVVENLQRAQTFIHALRARGIEFALDDFGVGSSSYSYLRSLDVAYLKIDGAFVRDIIRHDADRAVVESMNQIGHSFGLRTVAEFVESPEQLDVLSDIGVDFAQGSLVGEPRLLT